MNSLNESCFALQRQRIAFFFQFRDNHVYSFEFEGTFVEELIDNGCILELNKQGAMNPDESIEGHQQNAMSGFFSHQTSIENIQQQTGLDNMPSSRNDSSVLIGETQRSNQQAFGGLNHRQRTIQSHVERVKSVSNETFKHLVYYPIFDIADPAKIISVLEVGYKRRDGTEAAVMTPEVQQYLDQFRSMLNQFKVRLNSFSRSIENIF